MVVKHEFSPIYDSNSKILILGSFPSVKSREQNFYYGHPQNRFWRLIAKICKSDIPGTIDEKKSLCLSKGIALWDVIASCEIEGSSDSSIKNVTANNLSIIVNDCDIKEIFINGGTAYKLYEKYSRDKINRSAVRLHSTSPANAAWSLERLYDEWRIIESYL